jgi:hypothetical protein
MTCLLLVGLAAAWRSSSLVGTPLYRSAATPLHLSPPLRLSAIATATETDVLLGPVEVGDCARVSLERHCDLPLARLNVMARNPPLTDDAIEQFLGFLGAVLDRGEPFSVLWHVDGGAFPSMKQFRRVIAWLDEDQRSARWDELVQGNVAIIRSRLLRGAARLMTKISNPPQPSHVTGDAESALAFAKEHLSEARVWVK